MGDKNVILEKARHGELKAPDILGSMISDFWYLEQEFGETPSAFEVLPDGHAEIIFHFGSSNYNGSISSVVVVVLVVLAVVLAVATA